MTGTVTTPEAALLARQFYALDTTAVAALGFDKLPDEVRAPYLFRAVVALDAASRMPHVPWRFRSMSDGDDARDEYLDWVADGSHPDWEG